jgi:hypothetical protein
MPPAVPSGPAGLSACAPSAVAETPAQGGPAQAQDARGLLTFVETEVFRDEARSKSPDSLRRSLRECRAAVRRFEAADSRSHKALYAALERVYAFLFQAEDDPTAFEQFLAAAGRAAKAIRRETRGRTTTPRTLPKSPG